MGEVLNALSIDVEEHFHVHTFERVIHRERWDEIPSRVADNVARILRLLERHGVRATFFVLGWVADRQPETVRAIAEAGHEIATHGYWHELIYRQDRAAFADDVRDSLIAVRRALGGVESEAAHPIQGYRAPAFSVTRRSLWAIDVLDELGLRYDSSIFPMAGHDRYGIDSAARFANRLRPDLWEFPVSTVRWLGRNWPVAGGGYFRLLPMRLTRAAIRRINAEGEPAVIYLHPWEFDPRQPRVRDIPLTSRFRHYVNIGRTEARLHGLLQEFPFAPMCEVFAPCLAESPNGGSASEMVARVPCAAAQTGGGPRKAE